MGLDVESQHTRAAACDLQGDLHREEALEGLGQAGQHPDRSPLGRTSDYMGD
jgi:hypothetical protein